MESERESIGESGAVTIVAGDRVVISTDAGETVFDGVRRLPVVPLLAAFVLQIVLSTAANFWLFRSSVFAVVLQHSHGLINGTLLANLLLIGVVVGGCLMLWGRAQLRDLGFRRRTLGTAVLVSGVVWVWLNAVTAGAAMIGGHGLRLSGRFGGFDGLCSSVGQVLGQMFGNALFEEVAFRGVLLVQVALWMQRSAERVRTSMAWKAALISQGLFAIQHIPNRLAFKAWSGVGDAVGDLVMLVVAGLLFAGVFVRTRNLLVAVGLHVLVNTPMLIVTGPEWAWQAGIAVALVAIIARGNTIGNGETVAKI